MRTLALVAAAGVAASANAQEFVVLLNNSFETPIRADLNEFATLSIGDTSTQSLYPLNTMPLSPDPVSNSDESFVFLDGVIFQPLAEFDGDDIDIRFDSPQTGLGTNGGNFGFVPLEISGSVVTSNAPFAATGLPTTGDGRGSIVTEDSLQPVPVTPFDFRTPNGFSDAPALSGLNFEGGDPALETPFEVFFQDVQNNGINGPVDFAGGPGGSQSTFFTGESTGDFVGIYPAFTLAGFLGDIELVNTSTITVTAVTDEEFIPELDPVTGDVLVDTVTVDGQPVDFPRNGEVAVTTEEVEITVGDIRADANFDGVIETDESGVVENIGSQAYEFNDIDGALLLQFQTIPAAESEDFRQLQLGFHWARNGTGYEDENLNFFTSDLDGDGEPDLLIDTNGDGVPDATGNQQPDLLQVYINDVLIFEAGAEARVQEILDGATIRSLALEFGLFDPTSPNFGGVTIPPTEFEGFNIPGADLPTVFNLEYTPRLQEDPFGAAGSGQVGSFLPDGTPLPFVPGPVDLDGDGDIGGSDLNGDGIVGSFVNEGPDPIAPGPGNDDDSENPLTEDGLVPVGGVVLEQDPDEEFSDQDETTWPQAFFDFVDGQDGSVDGEINVGIGPISTARVLRNIDSNTAGGNLPVIEEENFLPELIDVSDFIGQDITVTVVAQSTAGSETLAIDNIVVRGTTSCNAADLNGDGLNSLDDILVFTGAFNVDNPSDVADLNGDGANTLDDILVFTGIFDANDPSCTGS